MVVDDDPHQTFTIKKSLEMMDKNYDVIRADGGIQCLNLLKNKVIPDLILLDIMMPDMNGHEVCSKLKSDDATKNIPVIFVTAKDEIDDKLDGYELGAANYITKPVDPNFVLEIVKKTI